jgi:hypothetical protein
VPSKSLPRRPLYVAALLVLLALGAAGIAPAAANGFLPPTLTKAFALDELPVKQGTRLDFTITNPNADTALTGIGFTDDLPAGLVAGNPLAPSGTCNGSVSAAFANDVSTITVADVTLAAGAGCTIGVNVVGTSLGVKFNTTSAITSVEGGSGSSAFDSIDVVPAFTSATWLPPRLNYHALPGFPVLLRFTLNGNEGLDIFSEGTPASRRIDCVTKEPMSDFSPATPAFGLFFYLRSTDSYTYFWSTSPTWFGTCRELIFGFEDDQQLPTAANGTGVELKAYFAFFPDIGWPPREQ